MASPRFRRRHVDFKARAMRLNGQRSSRVCRSCLCGCLLTALRLASSSPIDTARPPKAARRVARHTTQRVFQFAPSTTAAASIHIPKRDSPHQLLGLRIWQCSIQGQLRPSLGALLLRQARSDRLASTRSSRAPTTWLIISCTLLLPQSSGGTLRTPFSLVRTMPNSTSARAFALSSSTPSASVRRRRKFNLV